MLEQIDLKSKMSKEDSKPESRALKEALSVLQQQVRTAGLPVVVLFEGWSAAGKGGLIAETIGALDPRNFKVYSYVAASGEELRRPLLWRYWRDLPAKGRMSFLDRSWYQDISVACLEQELSGEEIDRRTQSILAFERQLCEGGYLLVKFFLHIDRREQKERLDRLEAERDTAWRVTKQDRRRNREYKEYYAAYDRMLESTDTPAAPWHVVPAHDRRTASVEVLRALTDALRTALANADAAKAAKAEPDDGSPIVLPASLNLVPTPRLCEIDMRQSVGKDAYDQALKEKQKRLHALHNKLYRRKTPVIVVYEGWDAAGKGGNIKRVSAALDPRGYEVLPIAAPTADELAHHYLWRFWARLPKDGHLAIFDRSWYGRVMVERVEGFCSSEEWRRAYGEINEFEKELHDWGALIVKFWLNVDQDEQLRRFEERQNTPEKQWKITEEDWRNRAKWDAYETAIDELLRCTSTEIAPWTVIESNDKRFARLKVLDTLIRAIEERL